MNLSYPRRQLATDIDTILADWRRPGQVNLLGLTALAGFARSVERDLRKHYWARSLVIAALILDALVLIALIGHFHQIFGS